jgi:RNA polymerase sigma-70 factor (ECF subfamily)
VLKQMAAAHQTMSFGQDGDETAILESPACSPFDELSRAETVDRVRTAIAGLPPVYREAIVLCELNELDYATASAVMDCPIGTVRSRLHRARALLILRLADMRKGALTLDGR